MNGLPRRAYRIGMWGLVVLGTPGLFAAFLGARRVIPLPFGIAGGFTFFAFALLGALVGLQARRQMQMQRDRESYSAMLVILATQLRLQDDTVLLRIADKGGPAGEAAEMVLRGRREKTGTGNREKGTGKAFSETDPSALADEISD